MFGCGVLVVGMAACGQQEEPEGADSPGNGPTPEQPQEGEQPQNGEQSPGGQPGEEQGNGAGGEPDVQRGKLAPPEQAENAFTYDPAAPEGAELVVTTEQAQDSTVMSLQASGLQPQRGYAVHAHENQCGPTGDDAGPHFQHEVDPAATPEDSSTDPAYANPENEFWLDTRTDEQGNAEARAEVPFAITERAPRSVVIHENERTQTEPGSAGEAGGRVACISLPDS